MLEIDAVQGLAEGSIIQKRKKNDLLCKNEGVYMLN